MLRFVSSCLPAGFSDRVTFETLEPRVLLTAAGGNGTGLRGDYYTFASTPGFDNYVLTRNDPAINLDWGTGAPAPSMPVDNFAVRWTGQVQARSSETFTFFTQTDGGVRLYVNNQLIINDWTIHALKEDKGTIALTKGQKYDIKMEYADTAGNAVAKLWWTTPLWLKEVVPTENLFPAATNGLLGEYFDNSDLTGRKLTRVDPTVNFDFGNGSPSPLIQPDTFSARWTGKIVPKFNETYTFFVTGDDGVRLWIDNKQIINDWTNHYPQTDSGTIALTAGVPHDIRLEYYESGGGAQVKLEWQSASQAREVVPQAQLFAGDAGSLLREYWSNISGNNLSALTSNSRFPNSPTGASNLTDFFQAPTNFGDNYGQRVRGYVTAPETGAYTFFISGDDEAQLFLSNDTDPANKQLIANVPAGGWTNPLVWNKYPSQKSATIYLVAGQKYYIEALSKEAAGGDNLAVGWQMPDGSQELPIPAFRFSPVVPTVRIWSLDSNLDEATGKPATFQVTRDDDLGRDLTVNYIVGGNAAAAQDYQALSGSIVIPKGQKSVTFNVTPINDDLVEGAETIHIALSPSPGNYKLGEGSEQAVDGRINDTDLAVPGTQTLPADALHQGRFTGTAYATTSFVPVSGMPFTDAMQFQINKLSPNAVDDVSLMVDNTAPINSGDTLLITFWARKLDPANKEAYVSANYRQNAAVPRVIDVWLRMTTDWRRYDIPINADATVGAGGARVEFRLGFPPETVQIGGLTMTNFGTALKKSQLPQTQTSYSGREGDASWRTDAQKRIDQSRKSDLTVLVKDANGNPIDGALVNVSETRPSYGIGASMRGNTADIMLNPKQPDHFKYQAIPQELFTDAPIESNLRWPSWNLYRDMAIADVNWIVDHGLTTFGHELVDGLWVDLPKAVKDEYTSRLESQGKSAALNWFKGVVEDHVRDEVTALKGKIQLWQVFNEPFNDTPQTQVGIQEMANWFKIAHQTDPNAALMLNDYGVVTHFRQRRDHDTRTFSTIQGLINNGAPITNIGIQSHFEWTMTGMTDVLGALTKIVNYGRKIDATEMWVSTTDDQVNADYLRDYMTMFYSVPQTEKMDLWGWWEPAAPKAEAAIVRPDWTLKPDGQAWFDLTQRLWDTQTNGTSWRGGQYKTRAYLGDYAITVTYNGQTKTVNATLGADGKTVEVVLGAGSTGAAKTTAAATATAAPVTASSHATNPAVTSVAASTSTSTSTSTPTKKATVAPRFITPSTALGATSNSTSSDTKDKDKASMDDLFA